MELNKLKIAGLVNDSIVDGPGIRYVIFFQGCPHHCNGCHNPQSHDYNKGRFESFDNIISDINKNPLLSGITISGGEPFFQKNELLELIKRIKSIKNKNLNILVYTGYIYEDLLLTNDNVINEIIENIDYLVDGPFILEERDLELLYRGSKNQRFIDIKKTKLFKEVITLYKNKNESL